MQLTPAEQKLAEYAKTRIAKYNTQRHRRNGLGMPLQIWLCMKDTKQN